jgi:hypothetical protein
MNPSNTPQGQQPPPLNPPLPAPDEQITEIVNPPVAPPPESPPQRQRISKKLLTATLIVLAIFIALYAGAYLFFDDQLNAIMGIKPTPTPAPRPTQKPDPLANWQTYTNNELGFTLRFPEGWKVTDESDTIRFTPVNAPIPTEVGTRPYGYELIVSADKENPQTPEAFWAERLKTGMRTPGAESITIDGVLGIVTSNNSLDAHDTTIYLSKNNTLYTIQENYYMSDGAQARAQFPQAEKEFQQILSTFTFVNPDQSDLSKWKDYTNKYYAIKYPTVYTVEEKKELIAPHIVSQTILKSESSPEVWITVASNTEKLTLENAIGAGPENSYSLADADKAGIKTITLGGSPAVRFDAAIGQSGAHPDVITIKNGFIYQITTKTNDNSYFDEMLSTFRFAN